MGSKDNRREFLLRFSKDFIFLNFSYLCIFLTGFIQLKLLTNYLSLKDFGKLINITATSLFIGSLTSLGLSLIFSYFVPFFESENKKEERDALIFYGILFSSLLYFGVSLIIFPFIVAPHKIPLYFLFLYYPYVVWAYFFSSFISMRKVVSGSILNIFSVVSLIVILYLIREFLTLSKVFIIYSIVYTVPGLLFFKITKIRIPKFTSFKSAFRKIKEFWKYAFVMSLISPFYRGFDRMVLPFFIPFSEIAYLGVARRIDSIWKRILDAADRIWIPQAVYGRKKRGRIFFKVYYLFYVSLAFVFLAVVLIFSRPLVQLVAKKGYEESVIFLKIFSFTTVITAIYSPLLNLLHSYGNIKLKTFSNLVWVGIYIFVFLLLAPDLGALGASWAWCIAHSGTMIFVVVSFILIRHSLKRKEENARNSGSFRS